MSEKNDPYQLKPKQLNVHEEQKLIQIKEEAPRLPPSIGTDSFQATFMGAPGLQPSKSEDSEPKGLSCGALVILILLFGPLAIFLISQIKGMIK